MCDENLYSQVQFIQNAQNKTAGKVKELELKMSENLCMLDDKVKHLESQLSQLKCANRHKQKYIIEECPDYEPKEKEPNDNFSFEISFIRNGRGVACVEAKTMTEAIEMFENDPYSHISDEETNYETKAIEELIKEK